MITVKTFILGVDLSGVTLFDELESKKLQAIPGD